MRSVAKIWIEKNGEKNIEIAYSELSSKDNDLLIEAINRNWDFLNDQNMCKIENISLGIKKLDFTHRGKMIAYFTDGRELVVPISFFPEIKELSMKERSKWMILDEQFFTFESLSKVYSITDLLRAA